MVKLCIQADNEQLTPDKADGQVLHVTNYSNLMPAA